MIDEVSVYLRKAERAYPGASGQFTAFLHALFKAVETEPNVALVLTLAVGKDVEVKDAYGEEHERALVSLAEAEMVAARKATQLNPTEEDETADVLRRRLFDDVDRSAADAVVAAYADIWNRNQSELPATATRAEVRDLFRRGYPLHPEAMSVLTEKLSSLSNFHSAHEACSDCSHGRSTSCGGIGRQTLLPFIPTISILHSTASGTRSRPG